MGLSDIVKIRFKLEIIDKESRLQEYIMDED